MKKKLHFDESFKIGRPLYILIDNGKIREYEGADFLPLILHGKPQPVFKTFELNSEFKLIKISKYDQKKLKIKANYKIECSYLFGKFLKDTYLKLSIFDKFIIDYCKKESILHKMNFTQKILGLIFISIPLLFFGSVIKSCENQNTKKDFDHSKKPDLTTKSHDTIIAKKKADNVSVITTKFERDSLVSN